MNHPYLVVYSKTANNAADTARAKAKAAIQAVEEVEGVCGICHDPLEDAVTAACADSFCKLCALDYISSAVGTFIDGFNCLFFL